MGELHNTGEEWILKEGFGSGSGATVVDVGLYNTSDNLADGDNLTAINTEPEGASYSRQTATIGTDFSFANVGGNWQTIIDDLVFDVSDSVADIDGYFVVVEFESEEAGDTAPSDNLLFSGSLDKTYDLNIITTFTHTDSGLSID